MSTFVLSDIDINAKDAKKAKVLKEAKYLNYLRL